MSIRYRRRRVLIIAVVAILALLYYFNNQLKEVHKDDSNDIERQRKIDEVLKRNDKQNGDPVSERPQKIMPVVKSQKKRTLREEIVEINGKRLKKIDWHDYDMIEQESTRTGPGEGGLGVEPSASLQSSSDFRRLYGENGFNAYVSNNISLDRSVKDIRHPR